MSGETRRGQRDSVASRAGGEAEAADSGSVALDRGVRIAAAQQPRMRILNFTPFYYPVCGGGESYVKEVSERLALKGHDVTVLTLLMPPLDRDRDLLATSEILNNVRVKRVQPRGPLTNIVEKLLRLPGTYRLLKTLTGADRVKMLADDPLVPTLPARAIVARPAVISATNWYHSLPAYHMLLARLVTQSRFVGLPFFHTAEAWSRSRVYPFLLSKCDAVIVMTEQERRFVAEMVPLQRNVHVVGAGVDPLRFISRNGCPIRRRYAIGEAPVVGYIGRIAKNKGVPTLIEAMKLVWDSHPEARLLLAGSRERTGRGSIAAIENTLGTLSEAQRRRLVDIGPFAECDKSSLFDACDIFVMASTAESFGISYLEAWMCEKPVIGCRIESTACVIDDGIDGLLVGPENHHQLAAGIVQLLENPRQRREMGRAGQKKAIARFTWDVVTEAIEQIYLDVVRPRQLECSSPGS